jgi:hypothetical protein
VRTPALSSILLAGVDRRHAAAIWIAWSVGYACSVLGVHRVIARHRRAAGQLDRLLALALGGITLASIALSAWAPIAILSAPLAAVSTGLALRPPRATRLRVVGLVLVFASVLSGSMALLAG